MALRNSPDRWGVMAQAIHWLVFILIVSAWFAVENAHDLPKGDPGRDSWMVLHKAFGASVFFLVWLRLGWRLSGAVPAPTETSRLQALAASGVHWGLYLLMVVMPLSGLLTMQFAGHPVSWFGLFDIPVVLTPDKALAGDLKELHEDVLWPALLVLTGLHVAGALWHHFYLKDSTLKRMLPFTRS
jgi:cytochrome b561